MGLILSCLCMFCLMNLIAYKLFKTIINPNFIFSAIWIIVIFMHYFYYGCNNMIYGIVFIGASLFSIGLIFGHLFTKKPIRTIYSAQYLRKFNYIFIHKVIIVLSVIKCFSVLRNIKVVLGIAGNFYTFVNNSTYVRNIYLSRSDIPSLGNSIMNNLFGYTNMLGIVLLAVYSTSDLTKKKRKRLIYLIIYWILLSVADAYFTMSKLGFFIAVFVFLFVYANLKADFNIVKMKGIIKIGAVTMLILFLLSMGIALQRNYAYEGGSILSLAETTLSKVVTYFVGPLEAFAILLDSHFNDFSLGTRMFRPIVKWLITFGMLPRDVLPPFFDVPVMLRTGEVINIYTIFGFMYKDFGILGYTIIPYLLGNIIGIIFAYKSNSLTNIVLRTFSFLIIFLSFYNFLPQESFYLLFPVFVFVLERLLIKKIYRFTG